jgi:hypothetical protein
MYLTQQDINRFWNKVHKVDGNACWLWTDHRDKYGYGKIRIGKKMFLAHRISYELHFGEVPKGKEIMHKCDNPPCCNPFHLCTGSHIENCQDRTAKRRNLLFSGSKNGNAKLNSEQVMKIRSLSLPLENIAKEFSISITQVKRIRNFKEWKWLGMQTAINFQ